MISVVSQLSFPLSSHTSDITVIDWSVSGSGVVPWDTREACQELWGDLSFTDLHVCAPLAFIENAARPVLILQGREVVKLGSSAKGHQGFLNELCE